MQWKYRLHVQLDCKYYIVGTQQCVFKYLCEKCLFIYNYTIPAIYIQTAHSNILLFRYLIKMVQTLKLWYEILQVKIVTFQWINYNHIKIMLDDELTNMAFVN